LKQLITDYTFDPTAKTVTLTGYSKVDIRGLIIITNVTDNIVIYSYADFDSPYSKGQTTATANVFTLAYDTTKMSATDNLQIYYDDVVSDESWKNQLFEYNASGLLIYKGAHKLHNAAVTETDWSVWKLTWDSSGNLIEMEGPLEGAWDGRASLTWG
jgi:YD repeat-containing protein